MNAKQKRRRRQLKTGRSARVLNGYRIGAKERDISDETQRPPGVHRFPSQHPERGARDISGFARPAMALNTANENPVDAGERASTKTPTRQLRLPRAIMTTALLSRL